MLQKWSHSVVSSKQAPRTFQQVSGCHSRSFLSHRQHSRFLHHHHHHKQARASLGQSTDDAAPVPQQQLTSAERDNVLQQLDQLRGQLEAAIALEDYSKAQQLKEQTDALKQQLSPVQQYIQHQLQKLASGSAAERAAAIKGLGEVGDEDCLPALAPCLSDPDLVEEATRAMWAVFMRGPPNADVQRLMAQGVKFMELGNNPLALEAFEAASKLAPSFAEARNKKATVLYLMKKFDDSIAECEVVLQLNPYHFGAASGIGMCYIGLQQYRKALQAFERTLGIHPGLEHIRHFATALKDQLPGELAD